MQTYRFMREGMPQTLSFSIIPAGTSFPAMGYLDFKNLSFANLTQATAEFGALFARYKVDKIVTILTPLFTEVTAGEVGNALRITRVNTKWLTGDFEIQSDSDDQLAQLSQLQAKSTTNYASNRNLILTTLNPGVVQDSVVDTNGDTIDTRAKCPWLNITEHSSVPLKHNSLIFAERTTGQDLTADWKYRVVHKVYFRVSQVG